MEKITERLRYIEGMVNVIAFIAMKDALGWSWPWVLLLIVGMNLADTIIQIAIRERRK